MFRSGQVKLEPGQPCEGRVLPIMSEPSSLLIFPSSLYRPPSSASSVSRELAPMATLCPSESHQGSHSCISGCHTGRLCRCISSSSSGSAVGCRSGGLSMEALLQDWCGDPCPLCLMVLSYLRTHGTFAKLGSGTDHLCSHVSAMIQTAPPRYCKGD